MYKDFYWEIHKLQNDLHEHLNLFINNYHLINIPNNKSEYFNRQLPHFNNGGKLFITNSLNLNNFKANYDVKNSL